MKVFALVLPVAMALVLALVPPRDQRAGQPEGWRTFEGTWSASGHRESLHTGAGRSASTVYLSGSVVLNPGTGISRGFRGEAIGFDDGATGSVGRCVWTDERGDRIFSTLTGETISAERRFTGTITGGTGRYAGIAGDYSFTWLYVVEADRGSIQGQTIGLNGRFHAAEAGR